MTANDVLWALADLFLTYGIPEHIRSDYSPEFVAQAGRDWLAKPSVSTRFIEPGASSRERLHRVVQQRAAAAAGSTPAPGASETPKAAS
jgi:hypothetical protein